jgi:hypothetical protein
MPAASVVTANFSIMKSETSGKAGGLKCEPLKAVGASR